MTIADEPLFPGGGLLPLVISAISIGRMRCPAISDVVAEQDSTEQHAGSIPCPVKL